MENEELDCDTVTCQGTLCGQIYWFSRDLGSASARARLQAREDTMLVMFQGVVLFFDIQ